MAERAPAPLRDLLLEHGRALFSGRVDVELGAQTGAIHFAEGQIIAARIGALSGEPALWRMLLARTPRVGSETGKPRATEGAVLGQPAPLIERFVEREQLLARYAEKVGGFGAVWALRFDILARRLDELPDAINPLLRLLDGRRTVRLVVVESSLDELLALRILARLLALGVLEVPAALTVTRGDEEPIARVDGLEAEGGLEDTGTGLEGALRASLEEPAHEPIPLETRKPAPAAAVLAAPPHSGSEPPGPMPAPDTNIALSLPRGAPPIEKSDELRVWLGSEEAFFERNAPTHDGAPAPAAKPPVVVPLPQLAVLVLFALVLGVVVGTRYCG